MYGLEKIAVVSATSDVIAISTTLNGSMNSCHCPSNAFTGPSRTTLAVTAIATTKVARLAATPSSGAQRRPPSTPSSAPAHSGIPSRKISRISISLPSFFLQSFHVPDLEAVEGLADLEEEDPEDERAHQDVEGDSQLDHQRHPVGRAGRGEEEPVLHCEEADDH